MEHNIAKLGCSLLSTALSVPLYSAEGSRKKLAHCEKTNLIRCHSPHSIGKRSTCIRPHLTADNLTIEAELDESRNGPKCDVMLALKMLGTSQVNLICSL